MLHFSDIHIQEKALSHSVISSSINSCFGGYSKMTSTEIFECSCALQ